MNFRLRKEVITMDEKEKLYQSIVLATRDGNNAEVKRDKEGRFVVYTVKKQRTEKIRNCKRA